MEGRLVKFIEVIAAPPAEPVVRPGNGISALLKFNTKISSNFRNQGLPKEPRVDPLVSSKFGIGRHTIFFFFTYDVRGNYGQLFWTFLVKFGSRKRAAGRRIPWVRTLGISWDV